jgi:hypothetical protein
MTWLIRQICLVALMGTMSMSTEKAPQFVRMVEVFSGEVRTVPFSEIPEEKRWVYLRDGKIVGGPDEADEVVPVVEIRRLTLDARGNLVAPEAAVRVRIEEVGPGGRPLRFTIMVRHRQ